MQKTLAIWFFIGIAGLIFPALAEVPAYELIKEKSSLKFFATQNGASVQGKFNDFSVDIRFDPEHLDQSSISAEVKTDSIEIANEDIEKNLKLPEWLSVMNFPKALYKSEKIVRMPLSDDYYATGKLTIRGKTLPTEIEFQLKPYENRYIAEGFFTIRRLDYKIGQGEWAQDDVIKNEVRITFRIVADKK